MTSKTPAIISSVLTVILLIAIGLLFFFVQIVALNGVSERQGMTALGLSLLCQSIGVILMGFFAAWVTNLIIAKFKWNKFLAVAIAVIAAILVGGLISFLSIIITISAAGIR